MSTRLFARADIAAPVTSRVVLVDGERGVAAEDGDVRPVDRGICALTLHDGPFSRQLLPPGFAGAECSTGQGQAGEQSPP